MFKKFTEEERAAYREKKQKIAEQQLQKIIDQFSTQNFPKILAKTYLENANKPSNKWSLGNQLLMLFSETTDARGYKQWQEVGRYPKKGSQAIYILGPVIVKKTVKDKKSGEETKEPVMIGVKAIPVFRYEDTEGKDISVIVEPKTPPPLIKVAQRLGINVEYGKSDNGEFGSYNQKSNGIKLSTAFVDTFFHELAHAIEKMLNGKLVPGQDPEQEAVAQLTACVLAQMYGYDALTYSWNYIGAYAGSKTPEVVGRMCLKVLSRVQKVLAVIFEEESKIKSESVHEIPSSVCVQ